MGVRACPLYETALKLATRPKGQRVDRVFGERGLSEERWKDRRASGRRLESRRQEGMDEAEVEQLALCIHKVLDRRDDLGD
jgi:hypothetical protein